MVTSRSKDTAHDSMFFSAFFSEFISYSVFLTADRKRNVKLSVGGLEREFLSQFFSLA